MELTLGFIENPIFQMDQVCNVLAIYVSFIVYIIINQIISPTGYEEKFYFNPGDTGFKVGVRIALIDIHCFERPLFCGSFWWLVNIV